MTEKRKPHLSFDEFDEVNYPRPQATDFAGFCERLLSRRDFLSGTAACGATAFLMSACAVAPPGRRTAMGEPPPFEPIGANTLDTVTVPKGYRWQVLVR